MRGGGVFLHKKSLFTFTSSGLAAGNLWRVCTLVLQILKIKTFLQSEDILLSQRTNRGLNTLRNDLAVTCRCQWCTIKGLLLCTGRWTTWKLLSCLPLTPKSLFVPWLWLYTWLLIHCIWNNDTSQSSFLEITHGFKFKGKLFSWAMVEVKIYYFGVSTVIDVNSYP